MTFVVGAGVLCAAAMMCTAGKMLQEKLDVFQLTFYTAPVSIAVLFPFFIAREVRISVTRWSMLATCLSSAPVTADMLHQ